MYVYRDYQVIGDMMLKMAVDDSKHLLWKEGGVPAIDAYVWDEYGSKVNKIYIRTKKGRRFKVDSQVFNSHKREVDLGWGRQYVLGKEHWDIVEPKAKIHHEE